MEAAICSETHLSWIVSVSAVEQGDAEAVHMCECLNEVLEARNNKRNEIITIIIKKNKTGKTQMF